MNSAIRKLRAELALLDLHSAVRRYQEIAHAPWTDETLAIAREEMLYAEATAKIAATEYVAALEAE